MGDPTKGNAMKAMSDFLLTRQVKWLAVGLIVVAGMAYESTPARAGNGAAFLGGMVTSHVVGGFVRRDRARTQAEMDRTYRQPAPQAAAPAPRAAPAPAASGTKSVEQKLSELNTLASKGFITKQEYNSRKKAILDGI